MRSRLGLQSCWSLLRGVRTPVDLFAAARADGASAVAIADRDGLYGLNAIVEASRRTGVRAIIASELTSTEGAILVFAENRAGFSRLCELLTFRKGAAPFSLSGALKEDSGGLLLASRSPTLLSALAGKVPRLYAAISPRDLGALRSATALGLPPLAVDDALFLERGDIEVHRVLRAIALGSTVGSLPEGEASGEEGLFLSSAEIEHSLSSWPEAIAAADEVASLCTFVDPFDGFVFPSYGESPEEVLRQRVIDGAEKRYGELSDAIFGRIDYELEVIGKKGFAPYFLVMDDIVSMASRTCGRGSGAASIVSYSLGITNVDPIAHNLYFERFLNMARPDPPDIDVDFAWDERDDLIRRVIERFGPAHAARVANHNMFRPRSALRETAKAWGITEGEISRMEKSLFRDGISCEPDDPLWSRILALSSRIEGLPRGLSMHCGGLVITPGPINRYAPIESSAEGFPLLAWEKEGTEAAGLVKIDLLGNRSLAVIRDALANLSDEGIQIDPFLWRPIEDPDTIAAFARGETLGVFYAESPAMRQLQRKTGRGDFEHLVIHSSIIRPAANKFINEYVRRLKGGTWAPLHPRLSSILDETYGILCYQEDVSKTAVALAGFSEVEADKLRKVIAKKAGAEKLREYEERFFSGCRENGVGEKTIQAVWEMMLSFDGYSFCKPHSASYAMVSFQSAWLRVHHPAAFIAAVLSNQGGYYRPEAYVSEARRMGLAVEGPCVNLSAWKYRGEGSTLVVGLMAIKGLSRLGASSLIAERERKGRFTDLGNVSARLKLSRDDLVSLVAAGAFDSVSEGLSRSGQIRALLVASAGGTREGQGGLFDEARPASIPDLLPPSGELADRQRRGVSADELEGEFATLGFLREHHPLFLWKKDLARLSRRDLGRDIPSRAGRKVLLAGWPVTQKEVWTSSGLPMDFVSFEDETALYETVLFPQSYRRFRKLLFDPQPLLLYGRVAEDNGAFSVEIEEMRPLRDRQFPATVGPPPSRNQLSPP